ncbi:MULTISPECIES: endonuclease III [Aerococcus]|uniref:endonuclease III n=1 Tax=Aerococcus TaxID=1375 RepID=UPI0018A740C8|nr:MULTISPECIES: endonuclease III [Aerococcus]MCY3036853.1 endonuclease III [Aerococcus sp. Group 2]MCY3040252.1 endonuclease III [Aerococcus sp. Group 2]MCY3041624.1 endonuclease III [Aerococcus sp. Group 2]MCY3043645.1 endonuclease III [Aerococcus sp. Group 2]MDK6521304.1 endonuclease III [Aerococcus urinae]
MLSDQNAYYLLQEMIKFYPHVTTELNYETNFQLLIAVILSAQSTDQGVNKVTAKLFRDYPTAEKMSQADPKDLEPYIQPIGLYKNKAKYIQKAAQQIIEDFDGQVPKDRKAIESISGVGRKTANVVLSIAYDVPAFAVDTHVQRVCKHHRIVDQDASVNEVEKRVTDLLDESQWRQAHQALVRFGRYICTARNPQCYAYEQLFHLPDPSEEDLLPKAGEK